MRLISSAVMVAVLALAPCMVLAQDQKAPASQPKCPYLKAKQAAGDSAMGCCPAKAEGDKAACKDPKDAKCDACPNKDKAACSQPAGGSACKKDGGKQAAAGSCCKGTQQADAGSPPAAK